MSQDQMPPPSEDKPRRMPTALVDQLADPSVRLLVVRHAERPVIEDLARHSDVRLTERGHAEARDDGRALGRARPRVVVHHSPVPRCAETARAIVEGVVDVGGVGEVRGVLRELGLFYVMKDDASFAYAVQEGRGFVRAWLEGRVPPEWFAAPREAAEHLEASLLGAALADPEALHVCVTHDWSLVLLRDQLLAKAHDRMTWPHFLDGEAARIDVAARSLAWVAAP